MKKRHPLLFILGFVIMFAVLNTAAAGFTPKIDFHGRLSMNDTFYKQNTEINAVLHHIGSRPGPKIIALGDSTMYGAIVHTNETIPYYLNQILNAGKGTDSAVPVYNLAYPGARPADLYAMLKEVTPLKPDLIVMDVNIVFFSRTILKESALADPNLDKEFLFERQVPKGVFNENRVEEAVRIFMRELPIGQNKEIINKRLFGKPLLDYIKEWKSRYVEDKPKPAPAVPENIIGKSWHQRNWGPAEQKKMARIYTQGPLQPDNDSVVMLGRIIDYANKHHLKILFYLTPQNDTLIGRFFSLPRLHANEQSLLQLLKSRGCRVIDLSRGAVPESVFGDYDHMLPKGNRAVAEAVYQEMKRKDWAP